MKVHFVIMADFAGEREEIMTQKCNRDGPDSLHPYLHEKPECQKRFPPFSRIF
jgi:hypothetical protein